VSASVKPSEGAKNNHGEDGEDGARSCMLALS
jgi:hypothetical protein